VADRERAEAESAHAMQRAAEQQHASLQAAGRAVIASLPPHEQPALGVPQQPGVDPLQPGVARHSPTDQYSGAVQPHSHATVSAAAPVPVSEAGATALDKMQQEMAALRKELEEERALRKSSPTRVGLGETGQALCQRLIRRLVAGQAAERQVSALQRDLREQQEAHAAAAERRASEAERRAAEAEERLSRAQSSISSISARPSPSPGRGGFAAREDAGASTGKQSSYKTRPWSNSSRARGSTQGWVGVNRRELFGTPVQ